MRRITRMPPTFYFRPQTGPQTNKQVFLCYVPWKIHVGYQAAQPPSQRPRIVRGAVEVMRHVSMLFCSGHRRARVWLGWLHKKSGAQSSDSRESERSRTPSCRGVFEGSFSARGSVERLSCVSPFFTSASPKRTEPDLEPRTWSFQTRNKLRKLSWPTYYGVG